MRKRFLLLATVAFAFSATPALAAPIPHNDDNPDNWGAVYNLDLCNGQPCEFSATSTDLVFSGTRGGEPVELTPCEWETRTFELAPHATLFEGIDKQWSGACGWVQPTDLTACVYSPSGFANGSADVELWLRDQEIIPGSTAWYAKAPDDAVGTYVYRIASFEFDQQTVTFTGPPIETATLDGTFDIDGAPVLVEHDLGATPCGYPEI